MKTKICTITEPEDLEVAAEILAADGLIVVFFQGTYAFLCDADATKPADKIFEIKSRPREKGLSLVVDPGFLPEFVDVNHSIFHRFPLEKAIELQRSLHALGLVFPAGSGAPVDLVQNGTIMNVWTEYPPHNPLGQLTNLARARGVRGFKGASTNLSHEATYNTVEQVLAQFDGKIPLILEGGMPVAEHRRKSTTLVDLTCERPTIIRAGNVSAEEVQVALDRVGFGKLEIAKNVKIL